MVAIQALLAKLLWLVCGAFVVSCLVLLLTPRATSAAGFLGVLAGASGVAWAGSSWTAVWRLVLLASLAAFVIGAIETRHGGKPVLSRFIVRYYAWIDSFDPSTKAVVIGASLGIAINVATQGTTLAPNDQATWILVGAGVFTLSTALSILPVVHVQLAKRLAWVVGAQGRANAADFARALRGDYLEVYLRSVNLSEWCKPRVLEAFRDIPFSRLGGDNNA